MTAAVRRNNVVNTAQNALLRAPLHYTEGPERWDAVEHPFTWKEADCSSFATSTYKGGGEPDPNHNDYRGGYTGTLCEHGVAVSVATIEPADLGFFGSGPPWSHTAVWGGSEWISHGAEGGPFKETLHYRSDLGQVRRYIFEDTPPAPKRKRYVFSALGRVIWRGGRGKRLPAWVREQARFLRGARIRRRA